VEEREAENLSRRERREVGFQSRIPPSSSWIFFGGKEQCSVKHYKEQMYMFGFILMCKFYIFLNIFIHSTWDTYNGTLCMLHY
jgi:hypothetical protein